MVLEFRPTINIVIQWSSYGSFHLARLNAAYEELKKHNVNVAGLEISTRKNLFGWEPDIKRTIFPRYVVFPGQTYELISPSTMWSGVKAILNIIHPDVVAINGYSYYDSWSALTWCIANRCPAILMSDSKFNDSKRKIWKEWIKRVIVKRFGSALCAGKNSHNYLVTLGIQKEKIFTGLDVVDNDFFWQGAEQARIDPDKYLSLPGLDSSEPYFLASARFVKSKNLDGLILAYGKYRKQVKMSNMYNNLWRLVILGDGVERNALLELVKSENISGITFAGYRQLNELPIYYGLASVFIHTAHQDTWGLVVNEAMAAGLPVLVSNKTGCSPDLVHEGINGYTFSPDDIEQIANLMLLLSNKNTNLKFMGQASLELISVWSPQRFSQGLYQALQEVK